MRVTQERGEGREGRDIADPWCCRHASDIAGDGCGLCYPPALPHAAGKEREAEGEGKGEREREAGRTGGRESPHQGWGFTEMLGRRVPAKRRSQE